MQSLWAATSPADCCSLIFVVVKYTNNSFWPYYCAEFMNSPFCCSLIFCKVYVCPTPLAIVWHFCCEDFMNNPSCCILIFMLCKFYEQQHLLQKIDIFVVQKLWAAPSAADCPLLLQSCWSLIFVVVESIWTSPSVAAWPFYCADFMNNPPAAAWSSYFFTVQSLWTAPPAAA